MSDIVERLRLREHDHSECIAEIERLRDELQASLKMTNGGERQLSAYLKLEAEIERLRAALEAIQDGPPRFREEGGAWYDFTQEIACRALEGK